MTTTSCTLVDSARLRSGLTVVSKYRGRGIPASAIATGFAQPSLLENDVSASDPAGTLYQFELTKPSVGTMTIYEDSSFSFTGAPDGTYTGSQTVRKNGVPDTGTYSFTIGAAVSYVSADYTTTYAIANTSLVSADYTSTYAIDALALVHADYTTSFAISNGGPMNFTPSAARTIKVKADGSAFSAPTPGYWNVQDPKKPYGLKDPDETLDVSFDWDDWLGDAQDSLLSATFEIGVGFQNVGFQVLGSVATVFISGGLAGAKLPVTCRIVTASVPARTADRTVSLLIEDR